jgi:hypothetical protein
MPFDDPPGKTPTLLLGQSDGFQELIFATKWFEPLGETMQITQSRLRLGFQQRRDHRHEQDFRIVRQRVQHRQSRRERLRLPAVEMIEKVVLQLLERRIVRHSLQVSLYSRAYICRHREKASASGDRHVTRAGVLRKFCSDGSKFYPQIDQNRSTAGGAREVFIPRQNR